MGHIDEAAAKLLDGLDVDPRTVSMLLARWETMRDNELRTTSERAAVISVVREQAGFEEDKSMSYIELGIRIPAELESNEVTSLLSEHPEMTRAEAWARVIKRVVGAWPDVTILKAPSTSASDMAAYLRGYLPRERGE